jgi:hypothetical protein
MRLVLGPGRPDVSAYYLCPDGERWGFTAGEHRELVPLEVARALGE